MSIEVTIVKGSLPVPPQGWTPPHHAGAVVCFDGIVRPMENERELAALEYEHYPPMTEREMHRLASQILDDHGLLAIRVEHSHGVVPVGACSFRLRIAARHRAEALAAMDRFITRMKRDVPVWKIPVWKTPS